jgi:hypothetical protein
MNWLMRNFPGLVWLSGMAVWCCAGAAETFPSYQEVSELLRSNLVESAQARLDRAAVEGLLQQLSGFAWLVTNRGTSATPCQGPAVTRTASYDGGFGYLRINCVGDSLRQDVEASIKSTSATNKIKGWVLDLRFAGGFDYAAAAAAAGIFVSRDQPLLDVGQGQIRSSTRSNAFPAPVMVLINRQTTGAAEALAAMLQRADSAVLIGTNTAGQAFMTRDFPLKNGQSLRIATAQIKIGDGESLSREGVRADIPVSVRPEEEHVYFEDPFKVLAKSGSTGMGGSLETNLLALLTNRGSHRRVNEADLVRIQREGGDFETEGSSARSGEASHPVLRDPALARAIDLLKGLAIMRGPGAK